MTPDGITRVKKTYCLGCGHTLDAVSGLDHNEAPTDGAACACLKCGAVMAFDSGGGLRPFTDAEIDELISDPETLEELGRIVKRIQIVRAA